MEDDDDSDDESPLSKRRMEREDNDEDVTWIERARQIDLRLKERARLKREEEEKRAREAAEEEDNAPLFHRKSEAKTPVKSEAKTPPTAAKSQQLLRQQPRAKTQAEGNFLVREEHSGSWKLVFVGEKYLPVKLTKQFGKVADPDWEDSEPEPEPSYQEAVPFFDTYQYNSMDPYPHIEMISEFRQSAKHARFAMSPPKSDATFLFRSYSTKQQGV